MKFEQPKNLTDADRKRQLRFSTLLFLGPSVLISILVLLKGVRRFQAGQRVSDWEWIFAAGVGGLVFVMVRLGMYLSLSAAKYVEFANNHVLLAGCGKIRSNRIMDWSFTPDNVAPDTQRLWIVYRFGLARKRWSMLLDDPAQIEQLTHVLERMFPKRGLQP